MISSFMLMNAQARSRGLLRPSALPYVNEFIRLLGLPLLAVPYSIALLALADGVWSLICNFFIFFYLFREKERGIY